MLTMLADTFWPSKRKAFQRVVLWGAVALFFVVWAFLAQQLYIASLSLPEWTIALYYVLIWYAKTSLDRHTLARAHAEQPAFHPLTTPRESPGNGKLRVMAPLQQLKQPDK